MDLVLRSDLFEVVGLSPEAAKPLIENINQILSAAPSREAAWSKISTSSLLTYPFEVHLALFTSLFPEWPDHPDVAPGWMPDKQRVETANITNFMCEHQFVDVSQLQQWSTKHYSHFWETMIKKLNVLFDKAPTNVCDLSAGVESPVWFPNAKLNIINSCLTANPTATAIIYQDAQKQLQKMTYGELDVLSNQIAHSLIQQGWHNGDAIGIAMPMNHYAIACYLGIIKMGGVVVSIADSFSTQEIHTRLDIAKAKAIITQDYSFWGDKKLPLYSKVRPAANTANFKVIVLPCNEKVACPLQQNDIVWSDFLISKQDKIAVACDPMAAANILFSSGTTGAPKAIVWNHTTPIKAASDAFFHHNIQPNDILAWPTNLGWMMGPWLIFAALMHQATIALYGEAPKDRRFGEFVQNAKVTMLGVVPTLVATWRETKCMEGLDWSHIKLFSSTGECSNPEDMLYLMSLAGYKPIIEYCGGTEIGGGYVTSTVIQSNFPSLFSTPALGMNFTILNEDGQPSDNGEVAIIPPSIGLSTQLLNADHKHVYFDDMPKTVAGQVLRRHGDQIKRFKNGYYVVLGRVDDTMKLGGIKTSAAEIERVLASIPDILEVAAIAIQPSDRGPSQLVIYASTLASLDKTITLKTMQKRINEHLNPLFKISDLILTKELPKTASNKIMRRVLRKEYLEQVK